MVFRKDYAFIEVVLGVVSFFIPIIVIISISADKVYNKSTLLGFAVASLFFGLISGLLILNAYYKLTDQLRFIEYEDYKKSAEEER